MRRFSQRNSLVTLSDINITPLLDLAFVLLIIFIITTPLLEKGIELKLPSGLGHEDKTITRKDIKLVEISAKGEYLMDHREMSSQQMMRSLEEGIRENPKMILYIRADENSRYKLLAELVDRCEQLHIAISLRSEVAKK